MDYNKMKISEIRDYEGSDLGKGCLSLLLSAPLLGCSLCLTIVLCPILSVVWIFDSDSGWIGNLCILLVLALIVTGYMVYRSSTRLLRVLRGMNLSETFGGQQNNSPFYEDDSAADEDEEGDGIF